MKRQPTGIICVGCKKDSSEFLEYTDDDRVQDDGTYANGKFVCTGCYCKLIDCGLDVGRPEVLQERMKNISQCLPIFKSHGEGK